MGFANKDKAFLELVIQWKRSISRIRLQHSGKLEKRGENTWHGNTIQPIISTVILSSSSSRGEEKRKEPERVWESSAPINTYGSSLDPLQALFHFLYHPGFISNILPFPFHFLFWGVSKVFFFYIALQNLASMNQNKIVTPSFSK